MGNEREPAGRHGPALYAYMSQYWEEHDTNQNAWCDAHPGIHAPTVSRWARGSEPKLAAFRQVADALGVPIVEVLIAAEVITPGEVGVTITSPCPALFLHAVATDPALTDEERATYPAMRAAFEALQAQGR